MDNLRNILCRIGYHNYKFIGRKVESLFIGSDGNGYGENWYDEFKCEHCGKIKRGWM